MYYRFDPMLSPSQLEFRIRLAERRLESYPLDRLDFVMMDLERPVRRKRHADFCTCDLTGRTIEFLGAAHRILPGCDDTRMHELFHRMNLHPNMFQLARRYTPYLRYTGDGEAWAAVKEQMDRWVAEYQADPASAARYFTTCENVGEGLADLYEMTGDPKYLPIAKAVTKGTLGDFEGAHSHGMMTILRAMLKLGYVSGDDWFREQVEPYYRRIQKVQYDDGSISESFPRSFRTEGCSTADWVMMNLRWFDLTGEEAALDNAEHSLFNGLFFNQFVTGGFGHRSYRGSGYGTNIEEAWWCCTQTGGMAMIEFAEHAVMLQGDAEGGYAIRVNFPIPGTYTLHHGGRQIQVRIISGYPSAYDVNIAVTGGGELPLQLRKPGYAVDDGAGLRRSVSPTRPDTVTYQACYHIGHYAEERGDGWVVKYGPLMLAPMLYGITDDPTQTGQGTTIPEGYIATALRPGKYTILEPAERDAYGFWQVAAGEDLPMWLAFDDGPGSHTGTDLRGPANITLIDGGGVQRRLCFQPMCYATSNLTLHEMAMSFGLMRHEG